MQNDENDNMVFSSLVGLFRCLFPTLVDEYKKRVLEASNVQNKRNDV